MFAIVDDEGWLTTLEHGYNISSPMSLHAYGPAGRGPRGMSQYLQQYDTPASSNVASSPVPSK